MCLTHDLMRIIFLKDEQLFNLLQNCSLVLSNFRCSVNRCRRFCNLQKRENCPLGFVFCCPSCKKKYSIFKVSFFEKSKISVRDVLFLLWNGLAKPALELQFRLQVVIQQYRFFRDVCSWKLLQNADLFLLGKYMVKLYNSFLLFSLNFFKFNDFWWKCIFLVADNKSEVVFFVACVSLPIYPSSDIVFLPTPILIILCTNL